MKPYQDISDPALAKALAHPLRTRILAALENRTASPSELAEELDASLGVLSYHVRRLTTLGFLKLVKRVPRRGAVEHYYTAVARPRITDEAWGEAPAIVKEATLRAALDQIGGIVRGAAAGGGFDLAETHLTRSPVVVDREGWLALARELNDLTERIARIETDSRDRLARHDHADEQRATVVLMLFQTPSDGSAAPAAARSARPSRRRARTG